MSDKLFDALDDLSDDEKGDNSDEDGDDEGPSINDALGEDDQYWKSRNQTREVQKALRDDEDED